MNEDRKNELAQIISTLEARHKHYEEVYERRDLDEMSRGFMSALNDFDYALQTLRAVRDDRGFDQDEE
ncbi:MAG TPA: hypothetical protein VEF04_00965 [Blastocatellia bacterium]|nr:hypothetical protein [Blastocatellia bacterium]